MMKTVHILMERSDNGALQPIGVFPVASTAKRVAELAGPNAYLVPLHIDKLPGHIHSRVLEELEKLTALVAE